MAMLNKFKSASNFISLIVQVDTSVVVLVVYVVVLNCCAVCTLFAFSLFVRFG